MRTLMSVLCLLALQGCFKLDLTGKQFTCATTDDCPEGQSCAEGLCVPPGQVPDLGMDLGQSDEDLLMSIDLSEEKIDQAEPKRDMAMPPDLSRPDLAMPDLLPPRDMAISGCSADGKDLYAGKVWACRGDFTNKAGGPGADSLCNTAAGFVLCQVVHKNLLGMMPGNACNTNLTGFYASAIPIDQLNDSMGGNAYDPRCDPGGGPSQMPLGLLGCGNTSPARPLRMGGRCDGLNMALRCDGGAMAIGFACTDALANATHTNTAVFGGGVLCCKP